jgi:hypothetical protein
MSLFDRSKHVPRSREIRRSSEKRSYKEMDKVPGPVTSNNSTLCLPGGEAVERNAAPRNWDSTQAWVLEQGLVNPERLAGRNLLAAVSEPFRRRHHEAAA